MKGAEYIEGEGKRPTLFCLFLLFFFPKSVHNFGSKVWADTRQVRKSSVDIEAGTF